MSETQKKTIDQLASQCVKCGLCLPHCPTYGLSEDENESPRGRIALLQALARGELQPSKTNVQHLDRCLACRHCERVCPADVKYEELLTTGRSWLMETPPTLNKLAPLSWKTRFLTYAIKTPKRIRLMGKLLRFAQITGLRTIGRYSGLNTLLGLNTLDNLLPKVPAPLSTQEKYPATQHQTLGTVGLFLGCMSQWCDTDTPRAAIHVLNQCGFEVFVAQNQGCCGALNLHRGNKSSAQMQIAHNTEVFNPHPMRALLTTASGCGATLKEISEQFGKDLALKSEVEDLCHFLLPFVSKLAFKPLNLKVAIHTPCTLQNGMKQAVEPFELLKNIPNLQCFKITEKETCCGSAGSYMLEHSDWASQLVNKILDELDDIQVDFVATSNIGCSLHLQQALIKRKRNIKVVHPIVLLARSLGWKCE